MPQKRVYGLGDPVLDIVVRVEDGLLTRLGAEPGGCVTVTSEQMAALLALPEVQAGMLRVPGGSAANVMKGLASLARLGGSAGGSCSNGGSNGSGSSDGAAGQPASMEVSFVGMIGGDDVGAEYERSIASHGVAPLLLRCATPGAATATCLCLVTPDGQRTMRTCLEAALELRQAEQLPEPLRGGGGGSGGNCPDAAQQQQQQQQQPGGADAPGPWALLHCEGYCLYCAAVAASAMRAAHAAGALVSIDLASFEVVANCWQHLDALLQERLIDVVFCNEQEAVALCKAAAVALPAGAPAGAAVAAAQDYLLSRGAHTAVVSRGSKGCSARAAGGGSAAAAASAATVVDTIGAGDFFTAGFLYALLSGASLQACAASGCAAGTAAVQVAGAELGEAVLQRLQASIDAVLAGDCAAAAAAGAAAGAARDTH
ncbi:carbohydrate kinase [Micractinium conductrix]|uniref:Carbohydrate kinase n=1 Tax=Micractinium conductrix TaxID=554055 RepID=A0A2P6V9Z0_9CHLO|nr:carbohydrate kinase [Micractinium conductrix]|eukprot:PSC70913.1 carbohydrate kinase [Micractinium conductrix]